MRKVLHLIRHGETSANASRMIAGWEDVPLTQRGQAQARALRDRFDGQAFEGIWSSDLARAVETARLAYREPVRDARIRELHFGDLEGAHWERLDLDILEQIADFRSFAAPGGETVGAMEVRIHEFVDDLAVGEHLLFTHGGVIRLLLHDLGIRRFLGNCAIVVVDWDKKEIIAEYESPAV